MRGHEELDVWVYRPWRRDPVGAMLVLPGLHFLGPADVRFDRFLAKLAHAGITAYCPLLPEFRRLAVGPTLVDDALATLDMVTAREGRVGVFSISFGSFPAIHCAAERPDVVRGLTLFGGYASFEDAIRFSLEGNPDRPHDPLNRPVVFINLVDHLPDLPEDRAPLRAAWVSYVRRTWGRPWMKEEANWRPISDEIAARVPSEFLAAFEAGTGAGPGGAEMIERALETGHETLLHLDPVDAAAKVRCPVAVVHGRDDDVIPHDHAQMLADAMSQTRARVLLTGLYGHTASGVVDLGALSGELEAMGGILEAIADCAMEERR